MSLNIKDAKTDKLAREVAELAGETITEAIRRSLEERREKLKRGRKRRSLAEELDEIGARCAALPDLDKRTADEILGYDKKGLWR
ncbi:MAG: type II toxin-antitoxin system VapB family antitoxin [Micropepsaceae bacterium]